MQQFNEKLCNLRKEKNITQEELASKLSVSIEEISKWETGECEPEIRSAIEIAKFFEISLDELFNVNTKQVKDNKTKKKGQLDYFVIMMYIVVFALAILIFGGEFYLKNFT